MKSRKQAKKSNSCILVTYEGPDGLLYFLVGRHAHFDAKGKPTTPGRYMFPGGGRNSGESNQDCAVRELKEETRLNLNKIHKITNSNVTIHEKDFNDPTLDVAVFHTHLGKLTKDQVNQLKKIVKPEDDLAVAEFVSENDVNFKNRTINGSLGAFSAWPSNLSIMNQILKNKNKLVQGLPLDSGKPTDLNNNAMFTPKKTGPKKPKVEIKAKTGKTINGKSINDIQTALGVNWNLSPTLEKDGGIYYHTATHKDKATFNIYPNKLTTDNNSVPTFIAMLKAFQALHASKTYPKIYTTDKSAQANWKTAFDTVYKGHKLDLDHHITLKKRQTRKPIAT